MMPSSVAMFFMMDQLSLLRPAEDNGARGPAHGEGAQPSEAAIPPQGPSAQELPPLHSCCGKQLESRGELQAASEEGRSRVLR